MREGKRVGKGGTHRISKLSFKISIYKMTTLKGAINIELFSVQSEDTEN